MANEERQRLENAVMKAILNSDMETQDTNETLAVLRYMRKVVRDSSDEELKVMLERDSSLINIYMEKARNGYRQFMAKRRKQSKARSSS